MQSLSLLIFKVLGRNGFYLIEIESCLQKLAEERVLVNTLRFVIQILYLRRSDPMSITGLCTSFAKY